MAEIQQGRQIGAVSILLVEDDLPFARLVRMYLDRIEWGEVSLEDAGTLADAIARIEAGHFELVIADLNLPDSKGLATLDGLVRATDRPIVVLSGRRDPSLREAAIAHGAYDLLSKDGVGRTELGRLVRLAAMHASAFRSLGESEARFRGLSELSSDMFWEQDSEYRFTSMSGKSPDWLKTGRAQVFGKHRWDQHYFNLTEADWAAHKATLAARQPFRDFELGRMNEDGERVWVSVSGAPKFDASGAFTGYRGVGKDITGRKREEQLQRMENAVTRCLAEAESEAAALQGVLRVICETENWGCGRYFRADDQAGVLRFVESWTVPGSGTEMFTEGSRTVTFAKGTGLAGRVWQSGQPIWVADIAEDPRAMHSVFSLESGIRGAFVVPVIAEGRTIGVLAFNGREVHQPTARLHEAVRKIGVQVGLFLLRSRAEEELRRFRTALDSSADMFFLVDMRSGKLIDFNDSVCRALGYTRGELLGQPSAVVRADRPQEQLLEDYAKSVASAKRAESSAVTYRRKDGSTFQVESNRRIIDTPEGPMMVVNSRDLTERLRAEALQAVHLRYQEEIARFGASALGRRNAAELIDDAVQGVSRALRANVVAYVERVVGTSDLIVRSVTGLGERDVTMEAPFGPADAVALVLDRGELVVVDHVADGSADYSAPVLRFDWARRYACAALVPVLGDDRVQGVLCALSENAGGVGAEESKFLATAASVLSAGLRRIDSEGRLAFLAQFDALTGLPNRALLSDRFSQMIVQARRHEKLLGVLFIDLDDFKLVNDSLGHAGGDELLMETARRLQSSVRAGDTVARISGDEFAVILGDLARPDDAALVAQKIIERLAAPVVVDGQEVFVTASIGISAFPSDGGDSETLLAAADAAMYRAKQAGRNGYQFFTADITQRTRARAQLGSELRHALEREEFALVYQPKFDLRTGGPCAVEALLRWKHPERGTVSPVEFIPVLEETGLIVQVGEWVLGRACKDLKAWEAAGLPRMPVAVNLSARQFRQQDLDVRIRGLVSGAGVGPELIELEITESQLMQDPDHAKQVIQALSDGGFRVAIDDFGTGYSSLSYLTRFPVAALKIDRSFVAKVLSDRASAAIVRTIIDMAHTLGFIVIAEGVETEAQALLLRGLGCEQAQGYYFARPMPEADFRMLISSLTSDPAGIKIPATTQ